MENWTLNNIDWIYLAVATSIVLRSILKEKLKNHFSLPRVFFSAMAWAIGFLLLGIFIISLCPVNWVGWMVLPTVWIGIRDEIKNHLQAKAIQK